MRAIVVGATLAFAGRTMADPGAQVAKVMGNSFMPAVAHPQHVGHVSMHPEAPVAPTAATLVVSNAAEPIPNLQSEAFEVEETHGRIDTELDRFPPQMAVSVDGQRSHVKPADAQNWRDLMFGFGGLGAAYLLFIIYKVFFMATAPRRHPVITMSPLVGAELQPPSAELQTAGALMSTIPFNGAGLQSCSAGLRTVGIVMSEAAEAETAKNVEEEGKRPKIESACDFDYVPLLTALQMGEFREADQLTRDALIKLAGDQAVNRGFVYYTEAPRIPVEDMATIERLWQTYSNGKFGYAVQAKAWNSINVKRDFDLFFERVGWKHKDGALLRWLPEGKGDEFIYDLEKAPKGHLPLTNTLRGQQLLQGLLTHEAWQLEEFAKVKF